MVRLGKTVKSALHLSQISSHITQLHFIPRDDGAMESVRSYMKRKGCLATYSICSWPLLQSHWLGGVSNAAEHRQVGGIHALSSSR